ncbi:MAG: class I SAM-dependent methyltransferase [Ekhidna sp.]
MEWCNSDYMEVIDFLTHLGLSGIRSVDEIYEAEFKRGNKIVNELPVTMGGAGAITLLYHSCEYLKANTVVETGVANGWSSLAILLSLSKRDGQLTSTDMPYAKMGNEDYVGCVVPENLRKNWELIRNPDIKALPVVLKSHATYDMCHYDSDKTYAGRMWAYPKLWKNLRSKGIFVSDDIGDNLAFKEFSESLNEKPHIIKFNNQFVGVLIKD